MFGKIQLFEIRQHEFHFCQCEINYTTLALAIFCRHEMILVRKTEYIFMTIQKKPNTELTSIKC